MSEKIPAIDAWATWNPPEMGPKWPEEMKHIFRRYKTVDKLERGTTLPELLAEMDAAGVERLVLSSFYYGEVEITNDMTGKATMERPDRFSFSGTVDPRGVMKSVREIERLVKEYNMRLLRLEPYAYGSPWEGLPPNDKLYWPLYAKCVELDIAVAIQVGHTGPLLPSECGRPIYLDEIALAFPELRILGAHLGQPWHEEMMILAWKHPNVYVETSARTPRHWPKSFVEFCRTYGQDKVIWGTDYPLLGFERTLREIDDLGFPLEVKRKLARENVMRALKL